MSIFFLSMCDVKIFLTFTSLSWPLSSNSRYKSKNDADEAVSVVSLTSSSGGYINGRNSANLELLINKTSSIYLYVKLKALASWIFLSFTSFWRNSAHIFQTKFKKVKHATPRNKWSVMLEFLIDNIFVSFGEILFQQVVDILMGTNCAPLPADLFLYSYESEFLQE
jgi:hypothetical protein